ncbi:unnamed protein product [Blepharisma stoltei]|uniref:TLC domain-containing protein n=1 Tax=Blepharisma stoltei TaxID=1481888 RepID=A0AAU9IRL7_9CILI|nr:unnamed protein product [Blepharisma stoltei]
MEFINYYQLINMDRLSPVCVFFLFYFVIALIFSRLLNPPHYLTIKESKDYIGQHISIIHAYCGLLLATIVYFIEGGINYNAPTNYLHIIVFANSLGYFIYDSFYAEIFKLHDWPMRFHHVGALTALTGLYFAEYGGSAGVLGIILTEISNPCILKRHIMKAMCLEDTPRYNFYETTFAMLFVFSRVIVGTWYMLNVWASVITPVYKLTVSALFGVSLFWVFILVFMVVKKIEKNDDNRAFLKRIIWGINWIKHRKFVLLSSILLISLALPYILTQVMKVKFLQLRVDGFAIL